MATGATLAARAALATATTATAAEATTGLRLVRRARGFAPRPVAGIETARTVLALGAHMKSTVALLHRGQLVPSQHLGDLETLAAIAGLERAVDDLCRFFDAAPDVVACDLHPDYASSEPTKSESDWSGSPSFLAICCRRK